MEAGRFGKKQHGSLWIPNHRLLDWLCRKFCNPSPGDGSAPNLVIMEYDENGQLYEHRAFNTQVVIF